MSPTPMRCLKCGYILEYLPENRCPECGRAFDPNDRSTYGPTPNMLEGPTPSNGRAALSLVLGYTLLLGLCVFAFQTCDFGRATAFPSRSLCDWSPVIACLYPLVVFCGAFAWRSYPRTARLLVLLSLVLGGAVLILMIVNALA